MLSHSAFTISLAALTCSAGLRGTDSSTPLSDVGSTAGFAIFCPRLGTGDGDARGARSGPVAVSPVRKWTSMRSTTRGAGRRGKAVTPVGAPRPGRTNSDLSVAWRGRATGPQGRAHLLLLLWHRVGLWATTAQRLPAASYRPMRHLLSVGSGQCGRASREDALLLAMSCTALRLPCAVVALGAARRVARVVRSS